MKICFYHEDIGTFLNLCPKFDCPLPLYFKKYLAAFFTKMSQKMYSTISAQKIGQKCKNTDVHLMMSH